MSVLRYMLYNLLIIEAEVYGFPEAQRRYVERLWAMVEAGR